MSEVQQYRLMGITTDDDPIFEHLVDRQMSGEEFTLLFMAAFANPNRQDALEMALPDQLGFEVRKSGTQLSRSDTDGQFAGFELRFKGNGFNVDEDGNPTAGTVTHIDIFRNGDQVMDLRLIAPFAIGSFLDAIEAGTGDAYSPTGYAAFSQLLVPPGSFLIGEGSAGADTFYGTTGNDQIDAKKGNDVLFMFKGNDSLDGNAGVDFVDARYAESAATFDLTKGRATYGAFESKLIDIENVVGSDFGDTIKGSGAANLLFGNQGDDTLFGKGGRDRFVFGADGSSDLVKDFQDGTDKLGLQFFEFGSKTEALVAFIESGDANDNKVQFSFDGTTVLITGADLADISGADILI